MRRVSAIALVFFVAHCTQSNAVVPAQDNAPLTRVIASDEKKLAVSEPGRKSDDESDNDGSRATLIADASAPIPSSSSSSSSPTSQTDGGVSTSDAPADMILVPAGSFTMGADKGGEDDEHPAHTVTLRAFYLDRTEVTQAAYQECVKAKACIPPSAVVIQKGGVDFKGSKKPVTGVEWSQANAFCAWKGKRLPHEAEFEHAVRDSDARRFPWGAAQPTPEITVFGNNHPDEVGAHPKGKGPYGHDDLAGNVWEWMADDYDPYFYSRPSAKDGIPGTCPEILAAQNDLRKNHKEGFTGSNPIPVECEKSIRGGAYNYPPEGLRSSNRVHHPARFHLLMTGIRCAKDAP